MSSCDLFNKKKFDEAMLPGHWQSGTLHEYYEAGYVDPSLAVAETSNDTRTNAQKTGEYLIGTQSYAFGYEYSPDVLSRGIEVAFVPCTDPYVDTTASQGAMMAISTASEHPVESFKFLALLNSDPTLMTLMNYGVEGVHYTLNADGLVEFTDERANYSPWTNGMGNVTILPDTAAEGAAATKGAAAAAAALFKSTVESAVEGADARAASGDDREESALTDTDAGEPDEATPAEGDLEGIEGGDAADGADWADEADWVDDAADASGETDGAEEAAPSGTPRTVG